MFVYWNVSEDFLSLEGIDVVFIDVGVWYFYFDFVMWVDDDGD